VGVLRVPRPPRSGPSRPSILPVRSFLHQAKPQPEVDRGPQARVKVQRNANIARNAYPRDFVARWRWRGVVVVPAYFHAIPNSRPVLLPSAERMHSAKLRRTMWLPPLGGIVNCSGNRKGRKKVRATTQQPAKKNPWPSTNVFSAPRLHAARKRGLVAKSGYARGSMRLSG